MFGDFLRSGRTTPRMAWAVLAVAAAVLGQTPAREYIRLGGRVIAIESPAASATTRYTLTLATAGATGVTASFTSVKCTQTSVTPVVAECDSGAEVNILATNPPTGYQFNGWTAGVGVANATLQATTVAMTSNRTITASYGLIGNVSVTLATVPAGLTLAIDGGTPTQAGVVNWAPGSAHSLRADDITVGQTRYIFHNWEDGSAARNHAVTASATTFTAVFTTQHQLTVGASTGGSVTVTPALAAGSWVDSGTSRTIGAVPNAPAYAFLEWTGSGAGAYVGRNLQASIVINNPITQTANFVALNQPPAVTPAFAVIRSPYASSTSFTFTAASAVTWAIRHTGGATFSSGTLEGTIVSNSTSFTYQAPWLLSSSFSFTITATNGNGSTSVELNVLAVNNTPQTVSVLTTPPGETSGDHAHFLVLYQDQDGYDDIDSMTLYFQKILSPANPQCSLVSGKVLCPIS